MLPDDCLGSLAGASCPINGARQVCHSRPLERTSWNRLARGGVSIDQTSSGGRPKESSCVSIRGSSFVEVCQGSADHGGAARPVPQRREADVDDLRLHGRDAAPRDRKSTRLNSSHLGISYAVFCLKKKIKI